MLSLIALSAFLMCVPGAIPHAKYMLPTVSIQGDEPEQLVSILCPQAHTTVHIMLTLVEHKDVVLHIQDTHGKVESHISMQYMLKVLRQLRALAEQSKDDRGGE